MNDIFQEIFASMKRNKLRTVLTGLSVSWGIFILIILLGAGNGLKNGVMSNMSDRATNTVSLETGTTSIPYRGLQKGRNVTFSNEQLDFIKKQVKEAGNLSPKITTNQVIRNKNDFGNFSIVGILPNYTRIKNIRMNKKSRFINERDVDEFKKVIVLDKKVTEAIFKNENPVGKEVVVGQIIFRVVGVTNDKSRWEGGKAYIPFSTAQAIFDPDMKFSEIEFTVEGLETEAANDQFNKSLRNMLSRNLSFDVEDRQAMYIDNSQEEYLQATKIFNGINLFITIIGILTMISGIVGVSNIMLVSVKERTREIGIRKAIGAPSSSILKSIIIESIIITAIFGYIGMMLGIGLTELINFVMEQSAAQSGESDMTVFKNPTVGLGLVFLATTILIISGVIAGYMPARKAVKIKPIEAMRQE